MTSLIQKISLVLDWFYRTFIYDTHKLLYDYIIIDPFLRIPLISITGGLLITLVVIDWRQDAVPRLVRGYRGNLIKPAVEACAYVAMYTHCHRWNRAKHRRLHRTLCDYMEHWFPGLRENDGPFQTPVMSRHVPMNVFGAYFLGWLYVKEYQSITYPRRARHDENVDRVSKLLLKEKDYEAGKRIQVLEYNGTQWEVIHNFLPEVTLLMASTVNFGWRNKKRLYETTCIVAPPGSGKTVLNQAVFCYLLNDVIAGKGHAVVMESPGQMLARIRRLAVFDRTPLNWIDPNDNIRINLFEVKKKDEGSIAFAIDTLKYVIDGIGAPMTAKQDGLFRRICSANIQMDGNFRTFMQMLRGKKFDLSKVDRATREYLETSFYSDRASRETMEQIFWRIDAILSQNKTLERILTGEKTTIKLDINKPGVTLVFPDQRLLGEDGASFFGRVVTALIMREVFARPGLGHDLPLWIFQDEAQDYMRGDAKYPKYIDKMRKYNCGFILAHQRLSQLQSDELRDALSNSATLICGRSRDDAHAFARWMNCTPQEITGCKPGEFMMFVRDETEHAVKIIVPEHTLEDMAVSNGPPPPPMPPPPPEPVEPEPDPPKSPPSEEKDEEELDLTPSIIRK